jgi:hypothetical protein
MSMEFMSRIMLQEGLRSRDFVVYTGFVLLCFESD